MSGAFEIMPDVCLCKEWLNRNQQPPRRLITNTGHITPLRHVWQDPTIALQYLNQARNQGFWLGGSFQENVDPFNIYIS